MNLEHVRFSSSEKGARNVIFLSELIAKKQQEQKMVQISGQWISFWELEYDMKNTIYLEIESYKDFGGIMDLKI
jgi:hypothetical protein